MSTLKELKKLATQRKIKGRSKMNKSQLMTALGVAAGKKSRKPVKKKSRKPVKKKSRKPRVKKKSRKPVKKKSRKPRVKKKSRKPRVKKKSRKPVKVHKSGKHTRYEDIISAYVNGDDKAINVLTVKRRNDVLHGVTFHGTKFGEVEKFKTCLEKSLGKNWAKRVLDPKDKLNVKGVKRLGVPGRQGTTIGLEVRCCGSAACKMYAIKVTRKGTSCGDGATGGMGFLKQARMQQLASKHGVTPPVDAVYCGHKKDVSFMVMPVLAHRLIDVYKKGSTLSEKHQKQLWDLYKILDTKVGIVHNDMNCLNIMIDGNDNLKLIDFDRSKVIEKKDIKRRGPYINLTFLELVNCFRSYGISPGENLVKNFLRIHGKNDDFLKKHGVTFKGASSFMGYVKPLRKPGVAAWCDKRSNCAMQFKMGSDDECNICLEKIPKDDNNGKGRGCPAEKCKAKFCSLCIDKWLEKNPTCPICRGAETSDNKKERKRRKKELAKVKNKSKELRSRLKRSALAVAALALGATAASFLPDKPLTSLASNLPPHFLDVPERHEVCFDANLQGGPFDDYHNYYEYANVADCRPDAVRATNPLHGQIYTYQKCRYLNEC